MHHVEKEGIMKTILKNYIMMTLAAVVYAAGVSLFLDPNALAPGGVTGLAIILNHVTGTETGTWVILFNIPILALGIWKFGFKFIFSTIYCTALCSVLINLMAPYGPVTTDRFLAIVIGGLLVAGGIGIIFKSGGTTGGTDIIIKLLRLRFPHLRTGFIFMLLDMVIVAISAIVFRNIEVALYAFIAVFINGTILDMVLYGRDGAKMLFIITDRHEEITKRLLEDIDVGATYINGEGAYTGREKKIIMCVMRKQLAPKAEEIIKEEDHKAFMIVTSATEIFGEGYKSIFSEKL